MLNKVEIDICISAIASIEGLKRGTLKISDLDKSFNFNKDLVDGLDRKLKDYYCVAEGPSTYELKYNRCYNDFKRFVEETNDNYMKLIIFKKKG